MTPLWQSLLWLVGFLIPLLWLQRQISARLLHVGWLLFHRERAAVLLYFVILFPGVLLHELSHLVAANVLGVRAGGLSLRPVMRRRGLELGSVRIAHTDAVRESLIGLAPLVMGSALVLLIAGLFLQVPLDAPQALLATPASIVEHLQRAFQQPNALLWLYLIFAISNAMLPSASDRQSWQPLAVYLGLLTATVSLVHGGLPNVPPSLVVALTRSVGLLALAFGLTLLVDLVFVAGIYATEQLLLALRRA